MEDMPTPRSWFPMDLRLFSQGNGVAGSSRFFMGNRESFRDAVCVPGFPVRGRLFFSRFGE